MTMILFLRGSFFCAALCAVSLAAAAQTTYKCDNSYSETPCADGKVIPARDSRTVEQIRQADETTTRQKVAASDFKKNRIAQEKRDAQALREAGTEVVIRKKSEPVSRTQGSVKFIKPPKPAKPTKAAKKKKAKKAVAES